MRGNRRLRKIDIEMESKKMVYIAVSCVAIITIAFVITCIIYNNIMNKKNNLEGLTTKIAELPIETINNNEVTEATSLNMGKTVNELKEDEIKEENNTKKDIEKSDINVSKIESINEQIKKENNITNNENTNQLIKIKEETKAADPTFIKPIEGEIITQFANESLVYSKTLQEWVTHMGIDIKSEKASIVKAAADGTIKSIKNDPRYGTTVVVEHNNGYVSVYSNLLTAEFVKEDEKIKQGQTIGTVGNTASFEIADESHLHFEILKNDVYVNPCEYIK